MERSAVQIGSRSQGRNPVCVCYGVKSLHFPCSFPWWPLRKQEVLSELFIRLLCPPRRDHCKLCSGPRNLFQPCWACKGRLPCFGPLPAVLRQDFCCFLWLKYKCDFQTCLNRPDLIAWLLLYCLIYVILNVKNPFIHVHSIYTDICEAAIWILSIMNFWDINSKNL